MSDQSQANQQPTNQTNGNSAAQNTSAQTGGSQGTMQNANSQNAQGSGATPSSQGGQWGGVSSSSPAAGQMQPPANQWQYSSQPMSTGDGNSSSASSTQNAATPQDQGFYNIQQQGGAAPMAQQGTGFTPPPAGQVGGFNPPPAQQPSFPQPVPGNVQQPTYGAPMAPNPSNPYMPPASAPMGQPMPGANPYGGYTPTAGQPGGFNPGGAAGMGAGDFGGMMGGAAPAPEKEDTTPANFQLGAKLPQVINIKIPPHTLQFDEQYFLHLLGGSISLTKDEKKRIIDSIPKLRQSQIDELVRIFEEERRKFAELPAKHLDQLKKLEQQHLLEWQALELEQKANEKKNHDQAQAEEIRKKLGI